MNTLEKFGKFVKYQREISGMSQRELANKAFGHQGHRTINLIETGKSNNITTDTMDKLLIALDCEVDFQKIKNL